MNKKSLAYVPSAAAGRQHPPKPSSQARFIDNVRVDHGPAHIIGRVFLKADQALRRRGVTLHFGTFEELEEVNRRNGDSWRPLLPVFDHRCWELGDHNSYCLLGRDSRGDVVVTQGGRLYEWSNTNFFEEARNMRLFYSDPERMARPGETAVITAQASRQITGRVVFSGAGWYRRDFRKRDMGVILSRVSRALAYTRWRTDHTTTIMAEGVFHGGLGQRAGYTKHDWELQLVNFAVGTVRTAVLWMPAAEMLQDLSWFVETFDSDIDGRVDDRRAN